MFPCQRRTCQCPTSWTNTNADHRLCKTCASRFPVPSARPWPRRCNVTGTRSTGFRHCSARDGSQPETRCAGMAAEIIVVVENQDSGTIPGGFAIKMRSGKPADACADNDQVIRLAGRIRARRAGLKPVVAKFVREGESAIMVPRMPISAGG